MLDQVTLLTLLEKLLKKLRQRYKVVYVDKVKEHKSKYVIYMVVDENKLKIIVDKYRIKARVYCGLKGLEISVKRALLSEYRRILERGSVGEKPV